MEVHKDVIDLDLKMRDILQIGGTNDSLDVKGWYKFGPVYLYNIRTDLE